MDDTLMRQIVSPDNGWALDAASRYPTSEVVGVDISQMMIDYARAGQCSDS
jgi:hypothetical protein